MTSQAGPVDEQVKMKALEKSPGQDGMSYRVIAYGKLRNGNFGTYANQRYFVHGSEEQPKDMLGEFLDGLQPDTVLDVRMTPGNLRQNKTDDGDFGSYFWNITHVFKVAGMPVKMDTPPSNTRRAPQQSDRDKAFEEATSGPSEEEGAHQEQQPAPQETTGQPVVRLDPTGARIVASWAIDHAIVTYAYMHPRATDMAAAGPNAGQENEDSMLAEVHRIAWRLIKMQGHIAGNLQGGGR